LTLLSSFLACFSAILFLVACIESYFLHLIHTCNVTLHTYLLSFHVHLLNSIYFVLILTLKNDEERKHKEVGNISLDRLQLMPFFDLDMIFW
jgi:hypothetical protein